ncbi:InlB B-repeat-containing protein [Cohnella cholangitidis]|uniref:InlB B-repeat-containing protein n=1 Tax=Cohnella cholangitidis TaxID=2598458 RepID=UPI0015FD6E68|nr:InlB B-repeat-containing protein [Cohnella cholangitidis]
MSSQAVSDGVQAVQPAAPNKSGNTFGGWYTDAGLTTAFAFTTPITGNTTLYAKWTPNTYTVTFNSNGGTAVGGQSVSHNGTATAPSEPTLPGSTFGWWYLDDVTFSTPFLFTTPIIGDTTLYAKWTINQYLILFNSDGGTAVSNQTVSHNSTATTPSNPTKVGHSFSGWYTDAGLTMPFAFTTAIRGNLTLYAGWTAEVYPVTFNSNGGTAVSAQSVSYNDTAIAPTDPTKTGYTFEGWYKDAGFTTLFHFTDAITGTATLHAKWLADIHTVTFESNGGTSVSSQEVSYDGTATEPADPAKTGYAFEAWYTDEDMTVPFTFSTAITGDLTLYANWTANSYAVTFDSNGGSTVSSQPVSYNNTATAPADPTMAGHTFEGWYTDEDLTTAFTFATAITGI